MNKGALNRVRRIVALTGLATAYLMAAAAHAEEQLGNLSSVLDDLRRGGFVIYFRHGPTDLTGVGEEAADLTRCETQRNLSAAGRVLVTQIGQAFQALRIPTGTITTSPFCRCKDTAKLAFGRFTVDDDLYYAIGTSAGETKRITQSLRRMLSTPPVPATNTIIVSHSANLREATGLWPKPEGVAYVFQPLPGNQFKAVAMIPPEDWANVAELSSPAQSR